MALELLQQLIDKADNSELQVRASASVGSDAAAYVVKKIKSASKGAPAFAELMEKYLPDFQFYEGLAGILDQRYEERLSKRVTQSKVTKANYDGPMFDAIAKGIVNTKSEIAKAALLPKGKPPEGTLRPIFELTFEILELLKEHLGAHHYSHYIGPALGLSILGKEYMERREHKKHMVERDAFLETAQFLTQLEDLRDHLAAIAVGVYRVPNFTPNNSHDSRQEQIEKRGISEFEKLLVQDPLPISNADALSRQALADDKAKRKAPKKK